MKSWPSDFLGEDNNDMDSLFPQRQWATGKPTPPPADECAGCGARPAVYPCPTCARLDALFVDLYEPRIIDVEPPSEDDDDVLPFCDPREVSE